MRNNWINCKIKDLGEVVAGGTPSTTIPDYWSGNIPWITPKDMSQQSNKKYISNGERYITKMGLINSSSKLLPKETVLFTSRAPIGYIGIATQSIATNQGFKSIVVNESNSNEFVYYLLKHSVEKIIGMAGGSTFKEINGTTFKEIEVKIPPLPTQRRIAGILSALDDKIENNRKICDTLEQIAQALFKRWFVDFDFPDAQGRPYKSSGGRLVESELELIPEGWENISIKDFSTIIDCLHSKKPEKKNDGNLFIQVYNIGNNGWINFNEPFYVDDNDYNNWINRMKIQKGDFVITKTGRVGAVGQMPRNYEAAMGRNMVGIRSQYPWFMRTYLLSGANNRQVKNLTNDGTIMPSLHVKAINKFSILGKMSLIKKFNEITKPIYLTEENLFLENINLQQTRDTLLPKLMSGEVEV